MKQFMIGLYGSSKYLTNFCIFLWVIYVAFTAPICFNPMITYLVTTLYLFILGINNALLNKKVLFICIYWVIVNVLCTLFKSYSFNLNNVIGNLIPLLIAFSSIVIIGPNIWEKLEKVVFYLTLISLFIFVIQVITGSLFDQFSSVFGRFIADIYTETRPTAWYSFIYTYSPIEDIHFPRNSGFMWEPGAYAMITAVFLGYRFLKYGVSLNKHNIVYVLALISTFSTAGYIMLILFFIIYIIETRNVLLSLILIVILGALIPYLLSLEFIGEKILSYSEGMGQSSSNDRLGLYEYNRFETFAINMRRLFEFPIGYGANQITDKYNKYFVGVNGIAVFARSWGVVGLIVALRNIISTIKMWVDSSKLHHPKLCIAITFVIFMVTFFSNPIERSLLFLSLIIFPLIYKLSPNGNK